MKKEVKVALILFIGVFAPFIIFDIFQKTNLIKLPNYDPNQIGPILFIVIGIYVTILGFVGKVILNSNLENKFKKKLFNKENNPKIFNYSINFWQIIIRDISLLFITLPSFIIASFTIQATSQSQIVNILSIVVLFISLSTYKFYFALDEKYIYIASSFLWSFRNRKPILLNKIKLHFIDYNYKPLTGQLIIRTNMGLMGYVNESKFLRIFEPTKISPDMNPTIKIRVRNMKDVQTILDNIGINN